MKPIPFEAKPQRSTTRRRFLGASLAGSVALGLLSESARRAFAASDSARTDELNRAIAALEPYFTPPAKFQDVSRGDPLPYSLSEEKKREVGLTRETWRLEVVSDPEHPSRVRQELTRANGAALNFAQLMSLAEKHAVRFPKVMTCLNIGCPLGMGIWEGVPLREVIALAQPTEDFRRVFFEGYHNDVPAQLFRGSLAVARVLEDPFDLPPVILCYKLNGEWLDGVRGGPVRVVAPEAYGFKSIKWVNKITLSNLFHANDTYAEGNNDIDSPLKTFAATFELPAGLSAGASIPVTGYAQVGISGLSKVQVWLSPASLEWPADDKHFAKAPWIDAEILPPPRAWGGDLPDGKIPANTLGFDPATGEPKTWPMRLCKAFWAVSLPGQPAGDYILRCRTIDEKGLAQPLPRPHRKSGHNAIEAREVVIGG